MDLPTQLREIYVSTGQSFLQAAADEIERLRAELKRMHDICYRCEFEYGRAAPAGVDEKDAYIKRLSEEIARLQAGVEPPRGS